MRIYLEMIMTMLEEHVINKKSFLNTLNLYAIILIEGFVTISLEILTIRQLIPFAGSSVVVTSLIIGVFLLFLAYGYRKGGYYTVNYQQILLKNFSFSAIALGLGLSYFFIDSFFGFVEYYFNANVLVPLVIYLLAITAPIVYRLGQTVPITFNLFNKTERVGLLSGRILHLSTIGSFAGAVLTSLLLLNFLGVAWTVFINYACLVILILLLKNEIFPVKHLLLLGLAGVFIFIINIQFEKKYFILTNNYANYRVVNIREPESHQSAKLLQINDSPSSYLNEQAQGFPYVEKIKQILFKDLQLTNKNILVLGAGGFTLSATDTQNNHFTYVDIDPQIASVAKPHFIKTINGKVIADDARHYLHVLSEKYTAIVVDAFSNRMSIPAHLLTYESMLAVRRALEPNGVAIFNIIANPVLNDKYSKRIDNTIRAVFSSCMVAPLEYSQQLTNILYVCHQAGQEIDKTVYNDNLTSSTLDFFELNTKK